VFNINVYVSDIKSQCWIIHHQSVSQQETRANAHATRDSFGIISYASCLRLSSVISAQFSFKMCVAA